jgi:hypothetical protein
MFPKRKIISLAKRQGYAAKVQRCKRSVPLRDRTGRVNDPDLTNLPNDDATGLFAKLYCRGIRHGIMTITPQMLFALIMPGLALSACAGSGDRYPSLAVRDAERVAGQYIPGNSGLDPATSPAVAVVSSQDLAQLVQAARNAHQKFLEARPRTRELARNGRAKGIDSDARARALIALADLSSLRSNTAIVLADIDLLEAQAATTLAPTQKIIAAQMTVAQLINEQTAMLDQLWVEIE